MYSLWLGWGFGLIGVGWVVLVCAGWMKLINYCFFRRQYSPLWPRTLTPVCTLILLSPNLLRLALK